MVPPLPVVEGGVTTGAGFAVVTGGGADCVTGAEVVVTAGAGAGVLGAGVEAAAATGLGLGAALWCRTAAFLCLTTGSAVVVCEVDEVVAGVEAAGVVLGVVPPPQPATATPTAIVASSTRFIDPAPIFAPNFMLSVQDTTGASTFR